MDGLTLHRLREHVETLAVGDGSYYVVCARTGQRPVPVAGRRFPDRSTARSAARAATLYRAPLRSYDPRTPHYDLVVCEEPDLGFSRAGPAADPADSPGIGMARGPDATAETTGRRVEFCHDIAAAAFEAVVDADHEAVQASLVDAYLELAEAESDPDELCLRLLESMAMELGDSLEPAAQADVLVDAAGRLDPPGGPTEPLGATFSRLQRVGLVGGYARSPWSVGEGSGGPSAVHLSGYALSPRDGRLPILPVAIEFVRRRPARPPPTFRVLDVDEGWLLTVAIAPDREPAGLATAPIGDRRSV